MRKIVVNTLFFILFAVLIYAIMQMPTGANVNVPAYNEVARHYLESGATETNSSNIIAAILADYRGFDTLGETIVLFTSVVAVGSVLRSTKYDKELRDHE
ncbi:MAG: hydrogen gas-evolving membrane-bound hydrogenase subunit E [Candidatus Izemoplasmatales bacterium]|jgi:multicomponent Na+:H+ antiporter subunit B